MSVLSPDYSEVVGGLGKAFHGCAHPLHAIRAGKDRLHGPEGYTILNVFSYRDFQRLENADCRRVGLCELSLDFTECLVNVSLHGSQSLRIHQHCDLCLERNCIAEAASLEIRDFHSVFLNEREDDSRGGPVGIGPVEDDVHTGMSSGKSLHRELPALPSFRSGHCVIFEIRGSVQSACASNIELTLGLRIEIQENVTLENSRLEAFCSCHSGLLIVCHEHLYRTVLQGIVLQY